MIARPSGRLYRVASAVALIAGGGLLAYGILAIATPDPKPVIRTVVLDVAPACLEIDAELQSERALVTRLDEARTAVLEESAALGEVALTGDEAAIVDQADALDDAKRAVQQTELDLATAQATLDAAVGDCTPERDS